MITFDWPGLIFVLVVILFLGITAGYALGVTRGISAGFEMVNKLRHQVDITAKVEIEEDDEDNWWKGIEDESESEN